MLRMPSVGSQRLSAERTDAAVSAIWCCRSLKTVPKRRNRTMQTAAHHRIASGTRILVTGAAGFIGQHVCRRLSALGLELHATSRSQRPRRAGEPIWWQADLADLDAARRIFSAARPDIVVHLAGMTGARVDRNLVLPAFHSLATTTVNVLMLVSEHECRRVILFGSLNEPIPSLEAATPTSPYAAAKWIGSAYGRMFHALYATPVVNLRPFMTYGPGQARDKLIPYLALALLRGERPRLSSGRVRGDWIYIDDVVDAFVAAAAAPGIEGQTLDIGTGTLNVTTHRGREAGRRHGKPDRSAIRRHS